MYQDNAYEFNHNKNDYVHSTLSSQGMRMGFIRKVYMILAVQLMATVMVCGYAMKHPNYENLMRHHPGFVVCVLVANIATICCLMCIPAMARTVPWNYAGLAIFTLTEAVLVSFTVVKYNPKIVMMAALMTMMVTIGLTVYAWTTKEDFTICGGMLFIVAFALLGVGIATLFWRNKFLHMVYSFCTVVLYGIYLIYDTQLLVGGRSR